MRMVLGGYLRRWHRWMRRLVLLPGLGGLTRGLGSLALGLILSAASLKNELQPFSLGLLCAGLPGWLPMGCALGASLGYWQFWGEAGLQGILWIAAGLPVTLIRLRRGLLQPALAALIVAAGGLLLQIGLDIRSEPALYVLRVSLAFGTTWLFMQVRRRPDSAADWVATALFVLALSQIAPVAWLNLGMAAGALAVQILPFPAAVLCGLSLDLAQICPIPMTAVLSLGALLRLLPRRPGLLGAAAPGVCYAIFMALIGIWEPTPLPALALGGFLGLLVPRQTPVNHRRGETGFAQVRLELAAGVLSQTEELLLEAQTHPIDEEAIIEKAAERACGTCPARKNCPHIQEAAALPGWLLHRPLTSAEDLPLPCRKRGRLLLELRRSQDQYRILKADRDRQQEYRSAVLQQYRFLSEFLQNLSQQLPRQELRQQQFRPEVSLAATGRELSSGDKCLAFAGTECRYYVALCDGMGTGLGAAEESRTAVQMLRRLLMAGFPASYALRSLNSLCTLRGRAGAVTVDLAECNLESGRVNLYKWGAAPSYLLMQTGPEKIGLSTAPPGLSVSDQQETVDRFTLRRGESLVLVSDGVDAQTGMAFGRELYAMAPADIAQRLLELGKGSDDATVAVLRLHPTEKDARCRL